MIGLGIHCEVIIRFLDNFHWKILLENFTLQWSSRSHTAGQTHDFARSLTSMYSNLASLQSLSVSANVVDNALLDALSSLPNLRELTFSPRLSFSGTLPTPHRRGFKDSTATEPPADTNFTRTTSGGSLETFRSFNPHPESLAVIAQLFTNLRKLIIQIALDQTVDLLSLCRCVNLETLDISAAQSLAFTDADLWDLLGSCEQMRRLSLNLRPTISPMLWRHGLVLPTLNSLIAVAQSGPNLEFFGGVSGCQGSFGSTRYYKLVGIVEIP